jgi:hypothetical protein
VLVAVKATGICHTDGFNHGFGLMKSGESIRSVVVYRAGVALAASAGGAPPAYAARNDACRSSQTGPAPTTILDPGTAWSDSRRSAA